MGHPLLHMVKRQGSNPNEGAHTPLNHDSRRPYLGPNHCTETKDLVTVVGVTQQLNGKMTGQDAALREMAKDWADRISKSYISRQLAH